MPPAAEEVTARGSVITRRSPAVGATILAIALAEIVGVLVLKLANRPGSASSWDALADQGIFQMVDLAFAVVGALAFARRPKNRIARLLAFVAVVLPLTELTDQYATWAYSTGNEGSPLAELSAWLASWIWAPAFGSMATLLLLWFPTGTLPSRRFLAVQRVAVFMIVGLPCVLAFSNDPESVSPYRNPLATDATTRLLQAIFPLISILFPLVVVVSAASLVVRFRRSRGEERQQLKWFVLGASSLALYMVTDTVIGGENVPGVVEAAAFASLPASVGVAILRYRLYDIDIIVNKTLVYGGLTAVLALAYLAIVIALQNVIPGADDSDLTIAGSTLAVAALFRPLRGRIQGFIDRRFYRGKYDTQRTLETFSSRLREDVDLDHLSQDLLGVVRDTMQPAHASLWLRPAEARR
jgi:hypothetical protein